MGRRKVGFSDLTRELRDEIYSLDISTHSKVFVTSRVKLLNRERLAPYSSLVLECKQVHNEYSSTLREHAFTEAKLIKAYIADFDFRALSLSVENLGHAKISTLKSAGPPKLLVSIAAEEEQPVDGKKLGTWLKLLKVNILHAVYRFTEVEDLDIVMQCLWEQESRWVPRHNQELEAMSEALQRFRLEQRMPFLDQVSNLAENGEDSDGEEAEEP